MSFLSTSFNPLASTSTTLHTDFKPAALSYFTIFCPALTPPKSKDDDNDPDNDTAREAAQILFYTSRARAAPKDRMLRQIGVAKGMVEFCSMVASASSSSARKDKAWNVHSSKRRMALIEVEEGVWVHASIDLPHTIRRDSLSGKVSKEYHDSLLADEWIEESIHRAWRDWLLLNGSPGQILARKQGRVSLERSLEKYFSVWAWSWDLESASSSGQTDQDEDRAGHFSVLEDCFDAFPIVPRAPRSRLAQLMDSSAGNVLRRGNQRELVVLSDTSVLWPPSNAGCLDSEDDDKDEEIGNIHIQSSPPMLDPQTRAEIFRRVISHLTGLEKEKDIVRATAVSTLSEARRRGTSGAIRTRSTANSNMKSKRDLPTGLGISSKRVASTPILQQRSTSASSTASTSTLNDSSKWSNWGGVFGGLGKLAFRGGDTPERSSSPAVEAEIVSSPTLASEIDSNPPQKFVPSNADLPVVVAPAQGNAASSESAGPFQLIQQRLSEAVPIQEAGIRMWSGAETAFKGLGASLGINGSSPSEERATTAKPTNIMPAEEVTDQDRYADASVDTSQISADPDASVITKVSILEPDVDINELSAALTTDAVDVDSSTDRLDARAPILEVVHEAVETIEAPSQRAVNLSSPVIPIEDINSSTDSASVRTGSSAKAFPSISVTSAAWYHAKGLKGDAATSETSSSPQLLASDEPVNKRLSFADTQTTEAGNHSQSDFEPADTSISALSLRSEHHDFELDGWGPERPTPFQTFQCHVGEELEPLCYDGAADTASTGSLTKHKVSFTTRRLLTLVLIDRENDGNDRVVDGDADDLEGAWQLLRRLQRILNDHERASRAKKVEDEEPSVRFLHLDGATQTYQSSLDTVEPKLDRDVLNVAEAHCLSAMTLMKRHAVLETFSRSTSGKTWTASRQSATKKTEDGNTKPEDDEASCLARRIDQTFMVQTGKNISIVDCDNQLRRLANVYPSFGI